MIDIVTVNWNAGSQLKDCIDSVLKYSNGVVSRIIVIDNGSTDGSAGTVESLPGVTVVRTGENLGFSAACNKGAMLCDAPYLLFLNPDASVKENSFTVPLDFMEQSAGVGVCGIQLVDESGKVSRTCARFPTALGFVAKSMGLDKLLGLKESGLHLHDWDHLATSKVDHVMGAFYLIRRDLFEALDGFDEQFFVYLEDLDLSYRVAKAGYDSWYLTEAQAFHAGGGTSRQVKAKRLFYSLRSRLLYSFKHFPASQAWFVVVVTGLLEPLSRTALCVLHFDWTGLRQTCSAYFMLWRCMGRIVHGEGRWNP